MNRYTPKFQAAKAAVREFLLGKPGLWDADREQSDEEQEQTFTNIVSAVAGALGVQGERTASTDLIGTVVTYDKTKAERLIAELRKDDERMTAAPWFGGAVGVDVYGAYGPEREANCIGVTRLRNNAPSLADQLEAAVKEIERLTMECDSAREQLQASADASRGFMSRASVTVDSGTAERDRLRAEVERVRPVVEAAEAWRSDPCKGLGSHRESALSDAVDAYYRATKGTDNE